MHSSSLPGPPNWVCSYNWPMGPAARPVEIGFVCTPRPRDSNVASGRSQTVSEPRIARSKAWNSHSIGVISAIRCLTKPEDKMSRPCGPEVPAGSAAVTEGHGGPPTDTSPIRRRLGRPVCYAKITNQKKSSSPDQPSPEGERGTRVPNREESRLGAPPNAKFRVWGPR